MMIILVVALLSVLKGVLGQTSILCTPGTYVHAYRIKSALVQRTTGDPSQRRYKEVDTNKRGIIAIQVKCNHYLQPNANQQELLLTSYDSTLPYGQWQGMNVATGQYITNMMTMLIAAASGSDFTSSTSTGGAVIGAVWMASFQQSGHDLRYTKYPEHLGLWKDKMFKHSLFPYYKMANTTEANIMKKDTTVEFKTLPIQKAVVGLTADTAGTQLDMTLTFKNDMKGICGDPFGVTQEWVNPTTPSLCMQCDPISLCKTCEPLQPAVCVSCGVNRTSNDTKCSYDRQFKQHDTLLMSHQNFDTGDPVEFTAAELEQIEIIGGHSDVKQSKSRQQYYVGGINVFGPNTVVKIKHSMPIHSKMLIDFKVAVWGGWNNNSFNVQLGDGQVNNITVPYGISNNGTGITRTPMQMAQGDAITEVNYLDLPAKELAIHSTFVHGAKEETVIISTDLQAAAPGMPTGWWGIREYVLALSQCNFECLRCNGPTNKDCTDCHGLMELRNGMCVCKKGQYKVIIQECETDVCVECRPCPEACNECIGPGEDQCVGCKIGQVTSKKIDGTTQCHDSCPEGTYDEGGECVSCGVICDNSMGVSTHDYSTTGLSPAVNAVVDYQGKWIVEKGFKAYLRSTLLENQSGSLCLTQKDLKQDSSNNIFPFAMDLVNTTGTIYSASPNGVFLYKESPQGSMTLAPQPSLSLSCTFVVPSDSTGKFICGDFAAKTISEVYHGQTTWTCQLSVPIYSLYMNYKDSISQNEQGIWVGSDNKVLLVGKPSCSVLSTITYSTINTNAQVRSILPSLSFDSHLLVLAAYDPRLSTFELQTWEVKGATSQKINEVSAQTETLQQDSLYKFQVLLVPFSTFVLVTTPKQIEQYNFLTYTRYSKFKNKGSTNNYMVSHSLFSAQVLRQESADDGSLVYRMWMPYPCIKSELKENSLVIQCTQCDTSDTKIQLVDGQCRLTECKTGYTFSQQQRSCVMYKSIGILTTNTILPSFEFSNGFPIYETTNQQMVLTASVDAGLRVMQVSHTNEITITQASSYLPTGLPTTPDAHHVCAKQTIRSGDYVFHVAPRNKQVIRATINNGLIQSTSTYDLAARAISVYTSTKFILAIGQSVKAYDQQMQSIWECVTTKEIQVIHSDPNSISNQKGQYFWVGSVNKLAIYSEKHGDCSLAVEFVISETKSLIQGHMMTGLSDFSPMDLSTVDPYIDSGLVVATSYSPSNHSLLVSTYQSNHGKHHNDDYFLRCTLLIPLSTTLLPPSATNLLKVTSVPLTNHLILYLQNEKYYVDVLKGELLSSYNSGQTTNQLIVPLSFVKNMNLFLQGFNGKTYGSIMRSSTACIRYDPDSVFPDKCLQCQTNYKLNKNKECVVETCIDKFNKNNFDSNEASCISPATSTKASFSTLVTPSYFEIRLDNELFSTLYTVDVTQQQYSRLTIAQASFEYSYSLELSPTSKDTLFLSVNLPKDQVVTPQNIYRFELLLGQYLVTPYFLENTLFTYTPESTLVACSDEQYYDAASSACKDKQELVPIVTMPNNPVIIEIDFGQATQSIVLFYLQDPQRVQVNINGLTLHVDYRVSLSAADQPHILVVALLYKSGLSLSAGQSLTITLTNSRFPQHRLTLSPNTFSLEYFVQPSSDDEYFDVTTGKVAKKKKLAPRKALPRKDNAILLEMNINSKTCSQHYKSMLEVKVFRKESISKVALATGQRQLQEMAPGYAPYDQFNFTVDRIGDQFKINMQFLESFQDRPQGQIGLKMQNYQQINADVSLDTQASPLQVTLNPNIVYPSDQQNIMELLKMIWGYGQLVFLVVLSLHLVVLPKAYYAVQIGLLYRFLSFYRLIQIDWSPLMNSLYQDTFQYDPSSMLLPIQAVPLDSSLPLHLRDMGLSNKFLDNFIFPAAKCLVPLLLAILLKQILVCLASKHTHRLQNDIMSEKETSQHNRSLISLGNMMTRYCYNLPLGILVMTLPEWFLYSLLDMNIGGEQVGISSLVWMVSLVLCLFLVALVQHLHSLHQQHFAQCSTLQIKAEQMIFVHYVNEKDVFMKHMSSYNSVDQQHNQTIVINEFPQDQVDITIQDQSKMNLNKDNDTSVYMNDQLEKALEDKQSSGTKSNKQSTKNKKKERVDSDGERIDTVSEEDNEFRISKLNITFIWLKVLYAMTCLIRQKDELHRMVFFGYQICCHDFGKETLMERYYLVVDLAHSVGVAWVIVIFQLEPLTTLKYLLIFLLGRVMLLATQSPYQDRSLKKLFLFNYIILMVISIYHLNTAMQEPDIIVYELSQQFFQETVLAALMLLFLMVNTLFMIVRLVKWLRTKEQQEHYKLVNNLCPDRKVLLSHENQQQIISIRTQIKELKTQRQHDEIVFRIAELESAIKKIKDAAIEEAQHQGNSHDLFSPEAHHPEEELMLGSNKSIKEHVDTIKSPGLSSVKSNTSNHSHKTHDTHSSQKSRDIRQFAKKKQENAQQIPKVIDEEESAQASANEQKDEDQVIIQENAIEEQ